MGSKVSLFSKTNVINRNVRVTEILKLVLNPSMSEKEIKSLLSDFWDKYDNHFSEKEDFCEFDFLCMFMLDCVFKRNGPTLSAVSRSLYYYVKVANLDVEDSQDVENFVNDSFVKNLREFTNFNSDVGKEILTDALVMSLLDGNFGLAVFLLKFGLDEIPTQANEKSRKIIDKLLDRLNDVLYYSVAIDQEEPSIALNDLLGLMTRSSNLRRSLMTFFFIVVISEHQLYGRIEVNFVKQYMEHTFVKKLCTLYTVFEATTEAKLKFTDIESFTGKFLNPLLPNSDFGKSLVQFSRNIHCHFFENLDPRPLKDLAKSTIRENIQNLTTLPEQVNKLDIPRKLKEFLLYDTDEILELLPGSYKACQMQNIFKNLLEGNVPDDFFDDIDPNDLLDD